MYIYGNRQGLMIIFMYLNANWDAKHGKVHVIFTGQHQEKNRAILSKGEL